MDPVVISVERAVEDLGAREPEAKGGGRKKGKRTAKSGMGRDSAAKDRGQGTGRTAKGIKRGGGQGSGPDRKDNVLAFPEPRGRRLRRNIMLAACAAALVTIGIIAGAIWSPFLAVRTVTVTGTKLLTPDAVTAALEPVKGTPLPQVTTDHVNSLLKPLVQIRSVKTEAHPPSELVVHVTERVPVALVKQGADFLLVDVDGVQLAATKDPASVSLPVIDGGTTPAGRELFSAITAVLATLPPDVLSQMATASAKSVDSVELKLTSGKTVVWGNEADKELKAKVLAALLKKPQDPKNPVSIYDVSTPRQPFTR